MHAINCKGPLIMGLLLRKKTNPMRPLLMCISTCKLCCSQLLVPASKKKDSPNLHLFSYTWSTSNDSHSSLMQQYIVEIISNPECDDPLQRAKWTPHDEPKNLKKMRHCLRHSPHWWMHYSARWQPAAAGEVGAMPFLGPQDTTSCSSSLGSRVTGDVV